MYNGYYYGFDMTYLVLVVPALLIALIAQIQVKSAFSRYARVRCTSGLTGAQAAQRILQANGITDVRIDYILLGLLLSICRYQKTAPEPVIRSWRWRQRSQS